jgi:ferric-chelate reductase
MSGVHSFASSSAPPHPHELNVPLFIFHINILLCCIFGLYVASTLPRALVRLFHPSEFLNGLFLRSGKSRGPIGRSNSARTFGNSGMVTNIELERSTSASSYNSMRTIISVTEDEKASETFRPLVTPRARVPQKPPPRVPRWTTILHPALAYALNVRVSPGLSVGKLLVLFIYSIVILYACLYKSDPFTDPVRMGFVAVSQFPLVVALAGKTNWLSWLCGVGYEKVCIDLLSPCPLYFSQSQVCS